MKTVELLKVAKGALSNSYAPYSNFRVSAVPYGQDGLLVGANVENASYGLTICAERVAVFKAVSEGKKLFETLEKTFSYLDLCLKSAF